MAISVKSVTSTGEQVASSDYYVTTQLNGCFYVVSVTGVAYRVTGVVHPTTKKPLAFTSRRAADAYCNLLNAQMA